MGRKGQGERRDLEETWKKKVIVEHSLDGFKAGKYALKT